ncbi:MAG: hypothetical protein IMZ61_06955 [Planctomycetes bacterium]|nr:hypothetical protein [Planctomycetota bacterium]
MQVLNELKKKEKGLFYKILGYHFDDSNKDRPSAAKATQVRAWIDKYVSDIIQNDEK